MEENKAQIFFYQKMAEAHNKDAILVMSFGTTFSEARKNSIEAVFYDVENAFPDKKVFLSFSSKTVIRRIKEKTGIKYMSGEEAIEKLKTEGYNRVLMLTMDLIPGHEYDDKKDLFCLERDNFKSLLLSTPLLFRTGEDGENDDLTAVIKAFLNGIPPVPDDTVILLMGHGSSHWANEYYLLLQEKISQMGLKNIFVYTIDGTPDIEAMIPKIRNTGLKKVMLFPFLMVAGDHAYNDMFGNKPESHRAILDVAGFEVDAYLHGLGENKEIRKLLVQRAKELWSLIEK